MRRLASLAPLLLAAALADPAGAQIVGRPVYDGPRRADPFIGDSRLPRPSVGREVGHLRERIERGRDSGTLGRREARRLENEARLIARLGRRYGRDGLSSSEQAELETRARILGDAIGRAQRGGGARRTGRR